MSQADELGSYEVKPNYRALGPRFGKHMPQVAAAVAALDPAHVADALRDDRPVGVNVDGHEHQLGPDDLLLAMRPLDGYQLEREGSHAVALELELDDALVREGLAREIVHAVQNARKTAGLEISDRIELTLGGDGDLLEAARAHEQYLAGETLAVAVTLRRRVGGRGGDRQGPPPADRRAAIGGPTPDRLRRHERRGWGSDPLERGLELGLEALAGLGALDARRLGAVAEEDHRGDREDPEARRRVRVGVDVHLHDLEVVAVGGDLLEDRGDDPARTAPGGPEVHEYRLV